VLFLSRLHGILPIACSFQFSYDHPTSNVSTYFPSNSFANSFMLILVQSITAAVDTRAAEHKSYFELFEQTGISLQHVLYDFLSVVIAKPTAASPAALLVIVLQQLLLLLPLQCPSSLISACQHFNAWAAQACGSCVLRC
jgi:hypothetical protein